MDWKPNKWIAAVLGFFVSPLGMLYLVRVKWAVIYFGIGTLITLLEFIALYRLQVHWFEYFSFSWIVMVVCAIHAYRLAAQEIPIVHRPWYSRWYGLVSIPLLIFVGIFSFRAFLYEPFRMASGSMIPTIEPGATVVTQKLGYGNYGTFGSIRMKTSVTAQVHRGDIVVFEYPENPSINYVMRIIGLPGDEVAYIEKRVSINGVKVPVKKLPDMERYEIWEEKLDTETYRVAIHRELPASDFVVSVPDGKYFVLGDSRDNSRDSRSWGFVPEENLVGKVVYILQ